MQRKRNKTKLVGPRLLLAGTAAHDIREFLHEAGLLGCLLPRLWGLWTRGWGGTVAVRSQVWLAVLELSLCRCSLRWRELSHALPHLGIAVRVLPWAPSRLSASRAGLGKRLVQAVVVDRQVRLLLPVLLALHVDGHRRVGVGVRVVQRLCRRWVRLEDLPALSVVQLHPVVLAILDLSGALESLGEKLA
jgi:hypothetical protein